MSSPLNSPSSFHRRIAPLPARPRSSNGQPGRSPNRATPYSLSPESSLATIQSSSGASNRRHSNQHLNATTDACFLSLPAERPPQAIFQFGQTGSNSQIGEQCSAFTFRSLHNVTPRPSPEPEEVRLASPQNLPIGRSTSSRPILSSPEQEHLQPLHTLYSDENIATAYSDKIVIAYSDEKIAIDGANDLPEPVHSPSVTASASVVYPSQSVPSLSFPQTSDLNPGPSPSRHSRRISDTSIVTEEDDTRTPYDVRDECAPPEPFFNPDFQDALKSGLDIAKSTAAAIERIAGSSKPGGDLKRLLKTAKDLGTFQSSDTRTIAMLGDSGQGNRGRGQTRAL